MSGFTQGFGEWVGSAEVYGADGRFAGNGFDLRQVQDLGNGRTRIDVSFIGPLKAAGYYEIADFGDHRRYLGPINVGYAETLASGLVDANAYWASLGLTQRFFLMVLGDQQLSLALMSRGEQVLYSVVGENQRRTADAPAQQPALTPGTTYDFQDDPCAGRAENLLLRPGTWHGELTTLDAQRQPHSSAEFTEQVGADRRVTLDGGLYGGRGSYAYAQHSNGWQTWTPPGEVVGSDSLYGGRARSGHYHFLESGLRLWRREVVALDGQKKALLWLWYRGGERVAVQYGSLQFEATT